MMRFRWSAAAALAIVLGTAAPAAAEGSETLGPPAVVVAQGSGIAVAGVGLFEQPAVFTVEVPADATVRQVLMYMEAGHRVGDDSGDNPDNTLVVNGVEVDCTCVGGPTPFFGDVRSATHRYDLTSLGFVQPGVSTLTVEGLDADEITNGAGVVVIYQQPGKAAEISLVDGNDIAFVNFDPPLDTTVPQTFTFSPAAVPRTAQLGLVVNSVHDPVPQAEPRHRPMAALITIAGTTTRINDPFDDAQGAELDSDVLDVTIPAGADRLTVQLVSEYDETGDLPASLVWLTAVLAVPTVAERAAEPAQATTVPPVPTVPVVEVKPDALPFTGADPRLPGVIGITALAAGVTAVLAGRRRSAQTTSLR